MEQCSEDLYSAIASYSPDRQIITFSEDMMVCPEGANSGLFQGPKIVSYFFHEWIHYLHNVSTIHGISAFSSFIGMWNAFRFTTDKFGFGSGKFNGTSAELLRTQAYIEVLATTRRLANKHLAGDASIERYSIISCAPMGDVNGVQDHLDLTVEKSNEAGESVPYQMLFGPTEILESVAYLLESHLLIHAFEQEQSVAPVFPYHALTLLAKHLAPKLNEKEVLICGLASLQSTFPADAVFNLLLECNKLKDSGEQIETRLKQLTINNLESHATQLRLGLKEIYSMFPLDVGGARAVKATVSCMLKNLDLRLDNPFFELDLIEDIKIAGPNGFHKLMDELMDKHGVCSCRQKRQGSTEIIGRDVLFNFAVAGRDEKLNESRLILLASFDYLTAHMRRDGTFQPTTVVKRCCPFYTSCIESTRRDHPDDCKNMPWRAVTTRPDTLCIYAAGVRDLGAPEDVQECATLSEHIE